ncbi:MAG: SelB C-terminal domain-containing protein, partial [Actinomycetota bacterium]
ALPPRVAAAVGDLAADLAAAPYAAPEAHRLRELGLGTRELATAVRLGALTRVADGVYLAPAAVQRAHEPLRDLPQPFTLADARRAWGTTRRVAVPLLELLDAEGRTRRLPDDRRVVTAD